ncbi:hypothetical protein [uncultured Fibrobacter sp.]|uniref:hypothetical protein n=1 Tax=uncultured Fibrobacter sp. TaxID=261512 RepID=UPI00262DDA90|nr:hypothetical protein [uncultured Fibrobacter sp.]
MNVNKMMYVALAYDLYKKKIDGQISAFNRKGIDVYLCCYNGLKKIYQCILFCNNGKKVVDEESDLFNKRKYTNFVYKSMQKFGVDSVYIRRPGISILTYGKIIRKIRKDGLKFIFEIPTYPFDCPGNGIARKLAQFVEKFFLKTWVFPFADCIPVFLRNRKIVLNKKMVRSYNCVDYERFQQYAEANRGNHTSFNMLAVAFTQKWHGYDRIIKSIEAYKGTRQINFTLYGNFSDETRKLMAYCKAKNISNVEFLEEKDVLDLVSFYSSFDIGIGTLGLHRNSNTNPQDLCDTSIKNKEYCAMGLPFVHASIDDSFAENFAFHRLVPDDESLIDIDSLIQWVESLNMTAASRAEMLEYAKRYLSFDNYIDGILQALKN